MNDFIGHMSRQPVEKVGRKNCCRELGVGFALENSNPRVSSRVGTNRRWLKAA
ncbi:MAG TPA: hypothetical protein VF791_11855 [Pyrinomonadaceae bacterium]